MYICICNQVTDGQIRDVVRKKGMTRLQEVCRELGTCNQCGKCAVATRQVVTECLDQSVRQKPSVHWADERTVNPVVYDRRPEKCSARVA